MVTGRAALFRAPHQTMELASLPLTQLEPDALWVKVGLAAIDLAVR
jgi:hypothetical protein